MAAEVEAEFSPQAVRQVAGDAFVLCSDGLSDLVEDQEILGIVAAEPAAQAVGKLVDLANARGGHDNVTVIVLRARETVLGAAAPVAPTVAQTSTTEAMATARSPEATMPESGAPSATSAGVRRVRNGRPAVVAGVALAVVAAVLLGGVLFAHFEGRRGKRNATTAPTLIELSGTNAPNDASLMPIAPEGIPTPSTNAPDDAIAPLESAPTRAPRKRTR
jgi:hypothetical protein